jgi:replication factor A1
MFTFFLEQIDLMKPGASIIVRNSKVEMFKGYMRLSVDKWGKIEPAKPGTKIHVNESQNRSTVEYELVTEENDNE